MWPFKKKPGLIRAKYLEDNSINTKFADAFQRSASVLRKNIEELKKQSAQHKSRANKIHEEKKIKQLVIQRLDEKIESTSGDKLTILKDLALQKDKEDEHFVLLSRETLLLKDRSKSVCNTIGLLEDILNGVHTDPDILSDPPPGGWAGGWEGLFGDTRKGGDVSPEEVDELLKSMGNKPKIKVGSKTDEDEDSADPVLDDGV
tara:strand:- start:1392 stop:2000 length:609 start_codon:yes stop_codon:yes gene_type:complete